MSDDIMRRRPSSRHRSLGKSAQRGTGGKNGRPRTNYEQATTAEKGWGAAHQKLRKQWAPRVEAGLVTCSGCGEPIKPGTRWELAHAHTPTAYINGEYLGPQHPACNRPSDRNPKRPTATPPALNWFNSVSSKDSHRPGKQPHR
jgi:hypothetical protein